METRPEDLLKSLQVMVVDDDPVFRRYLELQLAMLGCQFIPVGTAEAAWDRIRVLPPDLVLLDVFMPGMGGLELCRLIKSSDDFRAIPVVLLTTAGPKAKDEGYAAGADDFLNKPPHLVELRTRLHNLLLLRSLQASAETPAEADQEAAGPASHTPRILILESYGILREHLQSLLLKEDYEVQSAASVERFQEFLDDELPDVAIIDQDLMEGPGSALVTQLRNQAATTALPIILMSDPGALATGGGAYHSDADEHLMKPFEPIELRARVRGLLKHSQLRRRNDAHQLEADPSALKDPQSGAYTRAFLYASLDPLCEIANLAGRPLGLLAIQLREPARRSSTSLRGVVGKLRGQLKPAEVLCRVRSDLFVAVLSAANHREFGTRVEGLASALVEARFATVVAGPGEPATSLLKRLWDQLKSTQSTR
jgi:two-component system cell cycle response regulator